MPEDQNHQIDRKEPGGINRRSETARRGSDAASFVRGLANRRTESDLPSSVPTDATYEFVLKWGTKGSGDGQFERLTGISVAPDDSIVAVDTIGHCIQKFTSEGVFVNKWGLKTRELGFYDGQAAIAVTSDGDIYVTDSPESFNHLNKRIHKYTPEGVFVSEFGMTANGDTQIIDPVEITVAPDGNFYVVDEPTVDGYRQLRLLKFTPEGILVDKWNMSPPQNEYRHSLGGVAVASDGCIYVSDDYDRQIKKFTAEGVLVSKWGARGRGDGEFHRPNGVAVAPNGNVFVGDWGNERVQVFTNTGVFKTKWGIADEQFDYGWWHSGKDQFAMSLEYLDIAIASDGSVYVADTALGSIQKFSPKT